MLLPIGDDNQGRLTTPFVVYAIIAVNVLVFLLLQQAGRTQQGERFTYGYAVVPYEITTGEDLTGPVVVRDSGATANGPRSRMGERPAAIPEAPGPSPIYLTLLTAMFMHGGWMHILGNMLFLWVFGDNVEDNFGHGKFVLFYLICGLAASFAQIALDPSSPIPSLGASGAIAGVLGAYIVMFPRNRVRNLILWFIITTVELPAIVVIGFWFLLQVISQYTASFSHTAQTSGVAYMAHIGGFVTGLLLSFIFRSRQQRRNLPPFYDPHQR